MKPWTEFHIATVYFSSIFISLSIGIFSLFYLKPFRNIRKIIGNSENLWGYKFTITTLMAGLLGAMSVSFVDCNGSYEGLLDDQKKTIELGLAQIKATCISFGIMFGVWFLILMTLHMIHHRKSGKNHFYKIINVVIIVGGILSFYLFLILNRN